MQVLKEEIKEKIFEAAVQAFYEKGYQKTTMQDIAGKAGIAPSLIYSYYKGKQQLFNLIVNPVLMKLPDTLRQAEESSGLPYEKYINIEKQFFMSLLDKRLEFIILMDKSVGTSHHNAKEEMICLVEEHIRKGLSKQEKEYDDLFAHLMASNFVESFLEIVRHYKSREWAEEMFDLMAQYFILGSHLL